MYGTLVYLRSPSWREGDFVELSKVTAVDAQDSNLRITFTGEQPRGMRLWDGAAEVGIVSPDGSRMMCVGQMLSITCLHPRFEARAFVYEFGVVSAELLPIHVDEAQRRANIAAKADAERIRKLIGEGRIYPNGSPRQLTTAQEVGLEFRPKLEALADWEDSHAEENIDEVLDMITKRLEGRPA